MSNSKGSGNWREIAITLFELFDTGVAFLNRVRLAAVFFRLLLLGNWSRTMSGKEILGKARTALIIDWPSKDVPEALTLTGFEVVIKGGPGPTDYERYELDNGKPVSSHLGRPPDGADLFYSYRPVEELAEVTPHAKTPLTHIQFIPTGVSIRWIHVPE